MTRQNFFIRYYTHIAEPRFSSPYSPSPSPTTSDRGCYSIASFYRWVSRCGVMLPSGTVRQATHTITLRRIRNGPNPREWFYTWTNESDPTSQYSTMQSWPIFCHLCVRGDNALTPAPQFPFFFSFFLSGSELLICLFSSVKIMHRHPHLHILSL